MEIFLLALLLFICGFILFIYSSRVLPPGCKGVIDQAIEEPLPDYIDGECSTVQSSDLAIWYQSIMPEDHPKGTIVLIMGAAGSAYLWPDSFVRLLVDRGYHVIRYDNRGLGMTDWVNNWIKRGPYSIEELSQDVLAIMDALHIKKAHLVGTSMGGMIAQRLAISYPHRVLSIASMSSSGYFFDPAIKRRLWFLISTILRVGVRYGLFNTERSRAKLIIGFIRMIQSNHDENVDTKVFAEQVVYEMRQRKGFNPNVLMQHGAAIRVSGSRLDELHEINAPTLVVHGTVDPVIPFPHALKYAPLIPNAKTLWLENVGHFLPTQYEATVVDAIIDNIEIANTSSPQEQRYSTLAG